MNSENTEKRGLKKTTEAGTAVSKDPFEFVPSFLQRDEWEHESGEAGAVKRILKRQRHVRVWFPPEM